MSTKLCGVFHTGDPQGSIDRLCQGLPGGTLLLLASQQTCCHFWLTVNRKCPGCYLKEVTVHYYGPNRETTFSDLFNKLTGDPSVNPGTTNRPLINIVKDYVTAARAANITLRISESNSVPDGGQNNLSNTLGAALWTLVTALEFAKAGVSGINYHWGNGGVPGDPGRAPAYIGVQAFFTDGDPNRPYPVARVPWYGYVIFSRALGNNGPGIFLNYSSNAVVTSACNRYFFVYPILVPHAGMVSVVAANTNPNVTCEFTATLPGGVTTAGVLQRLQGPDGLRSVGGVTLAGQTYQGSTDGRLLGTYTPEIIQPHQETIRTTGWTFAVPPASGALLQIPLVGGAATQVGVPPVTPNFVTGGTQQAAPVSSAPFEEPSDIPNAPAADTAGNTPGRAGGRAGTAGDSSSAPAGLESGTVSNAGAGQYTLKGYTADGKPIYSWNAPADSSYDTSRSTPSAAGQLLPESGNVPSSILEGFRGWASANKKSSSTSSSAGLGWGGSERSSSGSSTSSGDSGLRLNSMQSQSLTSSGSSIIGSYPGHSSSSSNSLGGFFGRLFGGFVRPEVPGRSLLGLVSTERPLLLRSLKQYSQLLSYQYDTTAAVDPSTLPAAASAATQFGTPAPSGIGRIWPTPANTSNLDVGLYGLGGYTLFPPGYNQAAVERAAAQCPGVANILAIQARSGTSAFSTR
eukprot:GHRR01022108.1.p1 GENE.GHRR01022108.1~~GHRR01022108.1.p1  ORF type:complete len:686 (+),score=183.47 GHRR01022108.1:2788-4845(+)